MTFVPRLNANGIYKNKWWYGSGNIYLPNYGLPNCTCYCYGRSGEITGKFQPLPSANGGEWYKRATNFKRGKTPALGAVACWYSPTGAYAGHVAQVEQIKSNGDIVTSNSGYKRPVSSYPPNTPNYFWTETCSKSSGYRSGWMISKGYALAGFIYLQDEPKPPQTTDWISGNRYLSPEEMQNNAFIVYSLLYSEWTLNAISGLLGNMQSESKINPGVWQSLKPNVNMGFGLVQWTPATKLINWCKSNNLDYTDGNAQMKRIEYEVTLTGANSQWIATNKYPITFKQFTQADLSPEECGSAFLRNYERPASFETETIRRSQARYWYNYLLGRDPSQPDEPINDRTRGLKVWQMINYNLY